MEVQQKSIKMLELWIFVCTFDTEGHIQAHVKYEFGVTRTIIRCFFILHLNLNTLMLFLLFKILFLT